jgi:hypothetical protein
VAARSVEGLAEVRQHELATAPARLDERAQHLEAGRDELRLCLVVGPRRPQESLLAHILVPVEEDPLRRLSVAAGTTDLLVVGVERFGQVGMEDPAHVGLVDAHPERVRRDDDLRLAVDELPLRLVTLGPLQRAVVMGRGARGCDRRAELLGSPSSRHVDDAAPRHRRRGLHDGVVTIARLDEPPHRQVDVRAVEAADDNRRVAQRELADDVLTHRRRCRRGECEHARVTEVVDESAEVAVGRTEVVPPRADAVRLVDDHQRRTRSPHRLERLSFASCSGARNTNSTSPFCSSSRIS